MSKPLLNLALVYLESKSERDKENFCNAVIEFTKKAIDTHLENYTNPKSLLYAESSDDALNKLEALLRDESLYPNIILNEREINKVLFSLIDEILEKNPHLGYLPETLRVNPQDKDSDYKVWPEIALGNVFTVIVSLVNTNVKAKETKVNEDIQVLKSEINVLLQDSNICDRAKGTLREVKEILNKDDKSPEVRLQKAKKIILAEPSWPKKVINWFARFFKIEPPFIKKQEVLENALEFRNRSPSLENLGIQTSASRESLEIENKDSIEQTKTNGVSHHM